MQSFFPCVGCGHLIAVPASPLDSSTPGFLVCDLCNTPFAWDLVDADHGLQFEEQPNSVDRLPEENDGILESFSREQFESPQALVELPDEDSAPKLELEIDAEHEHHPGMQPTQSESETEQGHPNESLDETVSDWDVLTSASRRSRPQNDTFFRKALPPILGGIAAFPIATAIMWYGFGRDIGSTGPFVAEFAPWLVPEELRSGTPSDVATSRRPARPRNSSKPETKKPPVALSGGAKAELPSMNRQDANPSEQSSPSLPTSQPAPVGEVDRILPEVAAQDTDLKLEPEQTVESSDSSKVLISKTIQDIKRLRDRLYESPALEKAELIATYYKTMLLLSEQAISLQGRSATVWRKELQSAARGILADKNSRAVLNLGSSGKLAGVESPKLNDFVVAIIEIGADNEPDLTVRWRLGETWKLGSQEIPVEIAPNAWPTGSHTLPTTFLILGRLVTSESANDEAAPWMLEVHAALAK